MGNLAFYQENFSSLWWTFSKLLQAVSVIRTEISCSCSSVAYFTRQSCTFHRPNCNRLGFTRVILACPRYFNGYPASNYQVLGISSSDYGSFFVLRRISFSEKTCSRKISNNLNVSSTFNKSIQRWYFICKYWYFLKIVSKFKFVFYHQQLITYQVTNGNFRVICRFSKFFS